MIISKIVCKITAFFLGINVLLWLSAQLAAVIIQSGSAFVGSILRGPSHSKLNPIKDPRIKVTVCLNTMHVVFFRNFNNILKFFSFSTPRSWQTRIRVPHIANMMTSSYAVVSSMSHRASLATARGIHLWNCWNVVCMEYIILYSSGNKITTTTTGNIFRVTGPLCRWVPITKASDAEFDVFFDQRRNKGWVNNKDAGDLRRHHAHYGVTVMNTMAADSLQT